MLYQLSYGPTKSSNSLGGFAGDLYMVRAAGTDQDLFVHAVRKAGCGDENRTRLHRLWACWVATTLPRNNSIKPVLRFHLEAFAQATPAEVHIASETQKAPHGASLVIVV